MTLRGAEAVAKWAEKARKEGSKAFQTALKVEGFRLKKILAEEIRRGAPGGRRFAPLSKIRRRQRKGRGADVPLYRLGSLVRYRAVKAADGSFFVRVGFLTRSFGDVSVPRGQRISRSWARIIQAHQEGFTAAIDEKTRYHLIKAGALKRRGEVLSPRKGTARLRTPARPIADPFWSAKSGEAWRNIRRNYRRKIAGERI